MTLPVWVGLLTGSPGLVAGIAAAEILPSLLVGPFAGALADRLDARKAMIACDLARAALVLSLLLAPVSLLVPCVYAVGSLKSLVGLLFNPAKNVAVRSVVGPEQVGRALALSRSTESAALVLGPALGSAVLLASGPSAGLIFDALTCVVGAVPLRPPGCRSHDPSPATAAWRRPRAGSCRRWRRGSVSCGKTPPSSRRSPRDPRFTW